MGRAMLILTTAFIAVYSIAMISMQGDQFEGAERNAGGYAAVQARNQANSGIDLAIQKLKADPTWRNGGSPWTVQLDGGSATITLSDYNTDQVKIVSQSSVVGKTVKVTTIVEKYVGSFIPKITGAMGLYNDNFDFLTSGSTSIDGHDASGQGNDLPGVNVVNSTGKSTVEGALADGGGTIDGNPAIAEDNSMDFTDASNLIDKLANKSGTNFISGNYDQQLGTADNPGVFFVDDYVKLTGGASKGFGVLVVRSNDELDLSGLLDVKGNFTFNGLIIFEDGWGLNGAGTPLLNGAVMFGGNSSYKTTIDFRGTLDVQYNSQALDYANLAVGKVLSDGTPFKKVSVYE